MNWFDSLGVRPPYPLLVGTQSDRRKPVQGFKTLYCQNPLALNSFYRIVDPMIATAPFEVFITSPEFNFIEMAREFSLVETIGYGFELCGTYTPQECAKTAPETLPRLSTQSRLAAYANRTYRMPGSDKAKRAVSHVIDDSASIKETETAMLFCLPLRLNGIAMPRPKMNYTIKPERSGKTFVSQDSYKIDLYWPSAHVGLEVDTNAFHGEQARWIRDARRRNTLRYFGHTIVEATPGDMNSLLGMTGLAQQLCKLIGCRTNPAQFELSEARLQLYEDIFALSQRP